MKNDNDTMTKQITMIGASQSGKTTLAAGLLKTSDEGFTVTPADDATRKYLDPRVVAIDSGDWPEATVGEDKDLTINLNTTGGHTASISLKEYMGERIGDPTYIERIVGTPNGALILLSPGMDLLREATGRREMIGNIQQIIDHLKNNRCAAVALVVTACDRLATDLADFAPKFEEYVAEIANHLGTSGMCWKRFDVTITGKLADQSVPSFATGAANTAREPFLWILNSIARKNFLTKTRRMMKHGFIGVLGLVVATALVVGGLYWSDSSALQNYEKQARRAIADFQHGLSKNSEADVKGALADLTDVIDQTENKEYRFKAIKVKSVELIAEWNASNAVGYAAYIPLRIKNLATNAEMKGSEDECQKIDELLQRYESVEQLKSEKEKWKSSTRNEIRHQFDARQCTEFENKAEQKADEQTLETLSSKINNWSSSSEYKEKRNELLAKVNMKLANLKCETARKNILSEFKNLETKESEDIRKVLVQVREFEKDYAAADPQMLKETMDRIEEEEDRFLGRYEQKYLDANSSTKKRPEFTKTMSAEISDALSVDDLKMPGKKLSERILKKFGDDFIKAGQDWDLERKRECEDFVKKELPEGRPASDAFDAYRKWYEKNAVNPFVGIVDKRIEQIVGNFFDEYLKEIKRSPEGIRSEYSSKRFVEKFNDFKLLCISLNKECCGLTNSWCKKFASDCVNNGRLKSADTINTAFEQSIDIDKIELLGIYGNPCRGATFSSYVIIWKWNGSKFYQEKRDPPANPDQEIFVDKKQKDNGILWEGKLSVRTNPWTYSAVCFWGYIDGGTKPNYKDNCRLPPLRTDYEKGYFDYDLKIGEFISRFRVHCRFNGPDIVDIYNKARYGNKNAE